VRLPAKAGDTEHTHPTMVATTAAGNGKIKGVAPEATIYSDKWPDLGGADPMEVYKKIIEGKLRGENNIRVINNSWGLTSNNAIIFKEIRDVLKEFKKVVDMAEKAGIQIVFSAGNEGEELGFPSVGTLSLFGLDIDKLTDDQQKDLDYILDKVVLVGATNTQGSEDRNKHLLAEFSSLGDSLNRKLIPTVVAPGVDMMVYGYEDGKRFKDLVNGTSFSGPYVSGLVSLLFQVNPKLRPDQVRSILKTTSVKLPNLPDTYQGYGEVDPHAAVDKAKNFGRRRKTQDPKASFK
jgi:serine protease AprX